LPAEVENKEDKPVKTAYFDCFHGISGDMTLGALLDGGVKKEELLGLLNKLDLPPWELEIKKVMKGPLAATDVTVKSLENGAKSPPEEPAHSHGSAHHGHDHPHDHHHAQNGRSGDVHPHHHKDEEHHVHDDHHTAHHHGHSRSYHDIMDTIGKSDLPRPVKEKSQRVFERLAAVEAEIHGTTTEKIHFHEVGGLDAIIDIVGAVAGLYLLGIEKVYVSPLPWFSGSVTCQHGTLPLPAPATAALLKEAPFYATDFCTELITPTGAALVSTLADGWRLPPRFTYGRIGYGSGKRENPSPNVLRLFIGHLDDPAEGLHVEELILIETTIDNMNPEIYQVLMEKALSRGALDIYLTSIQMKKSRPATLVSILCGRGNLAAMQDLIFRETSTLGFRLTTVERHCLPRRFEEVKTPFGPVRMKVSTYDGRDRLPSPEYEDCRTISMEKNVPLREVMEAATESYRDKKR
jgi:uncharacterized protein (TIGR00299 family) protein